MNDEVDSVELGDLRGLKVEMGLVTGVPLDLVSISIPFE